MIRILPKIIYLTSLITFCLSLQSSIAYAQNTVDRSIEVSYTYQLTDPEAKDGDILINSSEAGFTRTSLSYDSRIFGVLQKTPLLAYRRLDNKGETIARNGVASVNVSNVNGPIKIGDYITSSQVLGYGQKATESGYVLGIALSAFEGNSGPDIEVTSVLDPQTKIKAKTGKITVALKIEQVEINTSRSVLKLLNYLNGALFTQVQNPDKFIDFLKYILAAIIILISFGIGFIAFSRSIPKGVEAIGRNPLAERAIIVSMVLNIVFAVVCSALGLAAAFLILRI